MHDASGNVDNTALEPSLDDAEDDFDDEDDEIAMIQMPARYLAFWVLDNKRKLQVSYGVTSEAQRRAIFPKRQPRTEPLSFRNFEGGSFYEFWLNGQLVGLCDVLIRAYHIRDRLQQDVNLEGIYLKPKNRKRGLLREFLDVVSEDVAQIVMSHVMREASAGKTAFEVSVEADLYSEGGQAAIRCFGGQIEYLVNRAAYVTGLVIDVDVIDNAW